MMTHAVPYAPSRRRVLTILAAAAGLPLVPGVLAAEGVALHEWRGGALGAEARLLIAQPDGVRARAAVSAMLDEVARLEAIFSLYQPQSELARLNRDGRLDPASHDLRIVLAEAGRISALSAGAFDVTIQPLWRLYAAHFATRPGDRLGPPEAAIRAARARVNWRAVALDGAEVRLRRPGMEVTLNGIAQGYISDRIADLLRAQGCDRVLVQMGETVALSPPAAHRPWRVGVPDPGDSARMLARLDLDNQALATSSGRATPLGGGVHHLFDPASGRSANRHASVTVIAGRAMIADAVSTALSVTPFNRAQALLTASGAASALFVSADGTRRWLKA